MSNQTFKGPFGIDSPKPYARAHRVLKKYSEYGLNDTDALKNVETAAITVLLQSAKDIYMTNHVRLSGERTQPASELLEKSTVKIAGIGMKRNDIADALQEKHGKKNNFTLCMENKNGCCSSIVNAHANDEIAYNFDKWKNKRISAVREAINNGADIICLGEFDYPPAHDTTDEDKFDKEILNIINGQNRPILCVAGSRHQWIPEDGEDKCVNRAYVIPNTHLKTNNLLDQDEIKYEVDKANSAKKAGELLSVCDKPQVKVFETILGKIAILICVDIFNPSIVLSVLNSRSSTPDKPFDYILVPAYNFSPKLYYSCQVLSLLCNTTVLLVDSCSETSGKSKVKKEKQVTVFISGRDICYLEKTVNGSGSPPLFATVGTKNQHVFLWELSLDAIREMTTNDIAIPFLSGLSKQFFPEAP